MKTFAYIGRDGPSGLELRKTVRERHLAHLSGLSESGRVVFGGPLRDDLGQPCGSLVILKAETLEDARTIANGDPYLTEGVFEKVEVFETLPVFPETTK